MTSRFSNWIHYFVGRCQKNQPQNYDKLFVFVIPAYNCSKWYKKNLDSVFNQRATNWRIIYIDDCSADNLGNLVEDYIQKRGFEKKVMLIKNQERRHSLSNIYHAVHDCADNEIIAILDGDDWLAHPHVLNILNNTYANPNVWLTYGNYIAKPGNWKSICREITAEEIANNKFRDIEWCTSHLKTFYAWLFKKIKKVDLFYENKFLTIAGDLAVMYPLLEMAGKHIKFISEILYVYNISNPLNDGQTQFALQQRIADTIKLKKKYNQIT